jgi:hypothetical protein
VFGAADCLKRAYGVSAYRNQRAVHFCGDVRIVVCAGDAELRHPVIGRQASIAEVLAQQVGVRVGHLALAADEAAIERLKRPCRIVEPRGDGGAADAELTVNRRNRPTLASEADGSFANAAFIHGSVLTNRSDTFVPPVGFEPTLDGV